MSGNIYINQIPVRQSPKSRSTNATRAEYLQAVRKPVAFHDCSGPVTLAVSTHLAMACPNVVEQEITRGFYYGWYHECVDQLPRLENGFIRPPEGHGLGLSLAADILTRPDVILRTTEA